MGLPKRTNPQLLNRTASWNLYRKTRSVRAGMVRRKAISGERNSEPYMIMPVENASITMSAAKNIPKMPCTISSCVSRWGMAVCRKAKPLRNMINSTHHNKKLSESTNAARKRALLRMRASLVFPIRQRMSRNARASFSGERNSAGGEPAYISWLTASRSRGWRRQGLGSAAWRRIRR